jgi:hypothetical protein
MVRYEAPEMSYFEADVFGEKIRFATEADYLKAKMAMQKRFGGGARSVSSSDDGGIFGGNFLETAATGLQTVSAFLTGRNLADKIDQLDDALDEQEAARAELEQLRQNPNVGILITPLLRFLDSERSATVTAQLALEDQVLAQDMQAGGGVASLVSKFTKNGSYGGESGASNIAAVAAGGLGLGLILTNRRTNNNNDRRSRRRR